MRKDIYKTGDLARLETDATFTFLGRQDTQVKSRGYHSELEEIEIGLNAHPLVVECVVVAVPDELVTHRIRAAIVPTGNLHVHDLATFCAGRLPRYMIPESFDLVEAFPKTSSRKIDREAVRASIGGRVQAG